MQIVVEAFCMPKQNWRHIYPKGAEEKWNLQNFGYFVWLENEMKMRNYSWLPIMKLVFLLLLLMIRGITLIIQ